MTASILGEAEYDLEEAFDYYEGQRDGLGQEMLNEFRYGIDRMMERLMRGTLWTPCTDDIGFTVFPMASSTEPIKQSIR